MMKLTHEEIKVLTQKYRELVARLDIENLQVNWHGSIDIMEDGAFVECTLFISKDKLNDCP